MVCRTVPDSTEKLYSHTAPQFEARTLFPNLRPPKPATNGKHRYALFIYVPFTYRASLRTHHRAMDDIRNSIARTSLVIPTRLKPTSSPQNFASIARTSTRLPNKPRFRSLRSRTSGWRVPQLQPRAPLLLRPQLASFPNWTPATSPFEEATRLVVCAGLPLLDMSMRRNLTNAKHKMGAYFYDLPLRAPLIDC